MKDKKIRIKLRKERTRRKVHAAANALPRLSVHKSLKFLYAQVIDDRKAATLASASSRFKDIQGKRLSAGNIKDAKSLGRLIAERALKAGVTKVVFDRGPSVYHGRVKALADAAREAGLKF